MRRRISRRGLLFIVITVCSAAAAGTSVALAVVRAHSSAPPPGVHVVAGASLATGLSPAASRTALRATARLRVTKATTLDASGPQILFRNDIPDKTFGKLAVAPLSHPNKTRAVSDLSCDRVYFAGSRGLCLTAASAFASHYVAKIFDASFKVQQQFAIPGIPSRARISRDGRLGAITTFVNGDSYSPGNFSTRTQVVDMSSGMILANIEQFTTTRDGKRFHARNFNFWGLTFANDDNHFYATLGSGANTYLVLGSIRAKTMTVIYRHLECPSLSPDGTRIAFKRSLNSHGSWRLYVLDLHTMRAHPLAETNSVDDQAEWLDNTHVLYWRANNIWVVPADGTGAPSTFVTDAASPTVVR